MIQRHNECLLASACCVAGVDYETASDLYALIHEEPWADGFKNNGRDWLPFLREYVGVQVQVDWTRFLPTNSQALPGKGIVILTSPSGIASHALAYADGVIYDPATDTYHESLDELIGPNGRYAGWKVQMPEVRDGGI